MSRTLSAATKLELNALMFRCPYCGHEAHRWCRAITGRNTRNLHQQRLRLAVESTPNSALPEGEKP